MIFSPEIHRSVYYVVAIYSATAWKTCYRAVSTVELWCPGSTSPSINLQNSLQESNDRSSNSIKILLHEACNKSASTSIPSITLGIQAFSTNSLRGSFERSRSNVVLIELVSMLLLFSANFRGVLFCSIRSLVLDAVSGTSVGDDKNDA